MPGTSSSGRRLLKFVAVGTVSATILLMVLIDPTFQLLIWCGVIVVCTTIVLAFWTKKQPILALYRHFSPAVRCLLVGCILWLFCFIWSLTIHARLIRFPDFIQHSIFFGLFHSFCRVLASPLVLGGWFLLWGDNGPPNPIFHSVVLNILCGVTLCVLLSAFLLSVIGRIKYKRTARTASSESTSK